MMTNKQNVLDILAKMASLDINDGGMFSICFDELVELLSIEEEHTILILNSLSSEQISWISPTFGAVSGKLQSKKFIHCIETLAKKYPDIVGIEGDVQDAIDAMDDE